MTLNCSILIDYSVNRWGVTWLVHQCYKPEKTMEILYTFLFFFKPCTLKEKLFWNQIVVHLSLNLTCSVYVLNTPQRHANLVIINMIRPNKLKAIAELAASALGKLLQCSKGRYKSIQRFGSPLGVYSSQNLCVGGMSWEGTYCCVWACWCSFGKQCFFC